ncbi:MAG: hypothetical protein QM776_09145 [Rhodocyclaceae bacterium]
MQNGGKLCLCVQLQCLGDEFAKDSTVLWIRWKWAIALPVLLATFRQTISKMLRLTVTQLLAGLALWFGLEAPYLSFVGEWPSSEVLSLVALIFALSLPVVALIWKRLLVPANRLSLRLATAGMLGVVAAVSVDLIEAGYDCELPGLGILNMYFNCACGCVAEVNSMERFLLVFAFCLAGSYLLPIGIRLFRRIADRAEPQ